MWICLEFRVSGLEFKFFLTLMSGGPKSDTEREFLIQVREVMDAGATGIAVGRNVWQSKDPLKIAEKLRSIVIEDKGLADALGLK